MEAFLSKITQHAMNYAIRSGIGITASYAINQTSRLLKAVEGSDGYEELRGLQERLDSKIGIIAPAIDMIELISARGNTTLGTAVALTKSLRCDIQSLGIRLEKAAGTEELSRENNKKSKLRALHTVELRPIVQDIQRLLIRIEDAVPLITLAITTSGAKLSTTLPASVSPSRLLQASAFITAGDTQYSINPNMSAQIGPTFTLSLYMLFASHLYRAHDDTDKMRDTTWKEIIHKARVKLVRKCLRSTAELGRSTTPVIPSIEETEEPLISGGCKANEFAYYIEIVEDLDDDRVHSFVDDEPQPGPYDDVEIAGIRESLPVYQVSKIFYADTGKILNIGSFGEANNPVLLLKRDINALPPRRMMQDSGINHEWRETPEYAGIPEEERDQSQYDIDQQLRRESSVNLPGESVQEPDPGAWRFPLDLDPEWLALEVYTEEEEYSGSDDEHGVNDNSAYVSHRPSSSGEGRNDDNLVAGLADLNIDPKLSPQTSSSTQEVTGRLPLHASVSPKPSPFGHIRSSLSLLEMLIRLASLQQFQQTSHLSIPDELLTFFLEESSTTGAGGSGDERRRTRNEARRKVGFDPYSESPVKRRGEEYQHQNQETYGEGSRDGTPYDSYDRDGYDGGSHQWPRATSMTPQRTPDSWLLRSQENTSSTPTHGTPNVSSSSPISPYRPRPRKATRPLDRIKQGRGGKGASPLGRGISAETDSTLGTSPGSPALVNRRDSSDQL